MIAGAAPSHSGEKRTATAWADSTGRHRHRLLQPRAAVAAQRCRRSGSRPRCLASDSSARATATVRAGDLQDVAGPGADAQQIAGRQPRDGVADVLDARFRDAERHGGRERRRRRGSAVIAGRCGHGSEIGAEPALDLPTAKRSKTRGELLRLGMVRRLGGDRHARSGPGPRRSSRIVPRLVCSIAQPSLLTAVTAMLSVVRVALPRHDDRGDVALAARVLLDRARDDAGGDPVAMNVDDFAPCRSSTPQSETLCYSGPVVEPVRRRESDTRSAACQAPTPPRRRPPRPHSALHRADPKDARRRGDRRPHPRADPRRHVPGRPAAARRTPARRTVRRQPRVDPRRVPDARDDRSARHAPRPGHVSAGARRRPAGRAARLRPAATATICRTSCSTCAACSSPPSRASRPRASPTRILADLQRILDAQRKKLKTGRSAHRRGHGVSRRPRPRHAQSRRRQHHGDAERSARRIAQAHAEAEGPSAADRSPDTKRSSRRCGGATPDAAAGSDARAHRSDRQPAAARDHAHG